MNIESVSDIYQLLNDDGILISYQGAFHQEIIEEITTIINIKLSSEPETRNKNKYLTMFVELSQNILRYSSDTLINSEGKKVSHGLIFVGTKDDKIFVISGNPIKEEYRDSIDARLKKLTNLSVDELNQIYKKRLRTKDDQGLKSSAGLGLLDIIRKADNSEYHILNLEPNKPFLTIKVEYKL